MHSGQHRHRQRLIGLSNNSPGDTALNKGDSTEAIRDDFLHAWNIFDVKVKRGKSGHPALLTSIQLRLSEDVGVWVIISPHCERLSFQPMTEFVADIPLQSQELKALRRISRLGSVQGLAGKGYRSCSLLTLCYLAKTCT